jgi:dynein heavy chain
MIVLKFKMLAFCFQGELSLTEEMEEMGSSLYLDQVPARWMKQAYPSMLPLTAWVVDLQLRHKELDVWLVDFQVSPPRNTKTACCFT